MDEFLEGQQQVMSDVVAQDGAQPHNFDLVVLEDAMKELYAGAKCTKLGATIFLVNLCRVHGVMNKFANELFAFLHQHLLPKPNCLVGSYYAAKTLTRKLGLNYKVIHTCAKRCVLFKREHIDVICCPKCDEPCHRDESNKLLLVKMLCHFLIIPKLQRMYRTPTLFELMEWHSKNSSPNGLVKHPCDSKGWKHVHEKFPNFASNLRNFHLALATNGVNPFKLQ